MKICTKCQIPQPLENFGNNKDFKSGKASRCKSCEKQYREENKERILFKIDQWRKNNKEKYDLQRKQYLEDNKERTSLRLKRWREENRERNSLKQKQWREENKERHLLKKKEYRDKNAEYIAEFKKQWYKTINGNLCRINGSSKRRAFKEQGDVTTIQLKELLKNSTHCFYCNNPLILNAIHIDHYIPLSKGGLHTISNLRIACKKCNLSKWNKMPEEFIKTLNKEHK